MTRPNLLIFFTLFFFSFIAIAKDDLSYVDGSRPFILIKNVNRQAEAWATCSATYKLMAIIFESNPAQAKKLKGLSFGASLAVAMSHVNDGLTPDITPERFNALWLFSKTLIQSLPETMMDMMLADAEAMVDNDKGEFTKKINATAIVCMKNSTGQQQYIDSWRDLAKSGLLKLP